MKYQSVMEQTKHNPTKVIGSKSNEGGPKKEYSEEGIETQQTKTIYC